MAKQFGTALLVGNLYVWNERRSYGTKRYAKWQKNPIEILKNSSLLEFKIVWCVNLRLKFLDVKIYGKTSAFIITGK